MIKASICQEAITIINVHIPKNRAHKYIKQTLAEVNERRNRFFNNNRSGSKTLTSILRNHKREQIELKASRIMLKIKISGNLYLVK